MKYQVGLIGHGAFGQAMEQWLAEACSFVIYDPQTNPDGLKQALSQPIIVLAIPAQDLAEFLRANQSLLNPDALYIDVCSVKVEPVKIMQQLLPKSAEIIATHPLFGPQSGKKGLDQQRIMVHPVRVASDRFYKFKDFLANLGLIYLETTPEEHDKAMAYVQGLSHYIGRIMQCMDIPDTPLATQAYLDLADMKNIQGKDSDAVFESILHSNPYTEKVLQEFETARQKVDQKFAVSE